MQSRIRKIIVNYQEITDPNIILNEIRNFCESLFKKCDSKLASQINDFLDKVHLPKLNITEINEYNHELPEKLCHSLMSMQNNNSPGNDGLTKELFVTFWEDMKYIFLNSCCKTKLKKELSISQKQAAVKLIEKKDKDKRIIKNWRPISLLNVDSKIISKALASRLKEVLPNLISPQQTTYAENIFIGESGRLIADIIEIIDVLNEEGFFVTMDIEKAFDSLDYTFVISVLKKFAFGNNFVSWIETLSWVQESCAINDGNTTQYFHLERGTCQGDPISAYIFILALEVLSFLVRNK